MQDFEQLSADVQRDLRDAYQIFRDDPRGRAVFEDMALRSFLLSTTFVPNDPYEMCIREGMRSFLLLTCRILGMSEMELVQLGIEAHRARVDREQRRRDDELGIDTGRY